MKTAAVVLDTSVIIKWFRQGEVLADSALVLRSAYLSGEVSVTLPYLLICELANVMRYKSSLLTEEVQNIVQSILDMEFEWQAPSKVSISRAVEMARRFDITVYDAVFTATAESRCAEFITADKRLVDQLKDLPFVVYLGEIDSKG